MNKSSSRKFLFPPRHDLHHYGDYQKSFGIKRPKFLRYLRICTMMSSINKPFLRNLKHLKYVSSFELTFHKDFKGKLGNILLPSIKTVKHVQVFQTYNVSIKTLMLANRYFSDLKSYSLSLVQAEVLKSFRTLRNTQTLKISSSSLNIWGKVSKDGRNLKRIAMKKMILHGSKINPSDMMKIASLLPKSTHLHFELDELLQGVNENEIHAKEAEKIDGIRMKQLSSNSLNSIAQVAGYCKNLTYLNLGKPDWRYGGDKLNLETNSPFFSKLGELTKLRSLEMSLNLTIDGTIEILKLLTLPIRLETLSLGLEGIVLKETSALTRDDLGRMFDQIGKMKELKTLKFDFYMHHFGQKLCEDFVSLFPRGLPKLEVLSTEFGIWKPEGLIMLENVFEWLHSHPMLRSVRLDLSGLNSLELDTRKVFDYKMRSLESFSVNIAHSKTEMGESFEDLAKFLASHESLKSLTLKIFKSDDFTKTFEIIMGALNNLKELSLEFVIFDERELEKFACFKPLMKKFRHFSLRIEKINIYYENTIKYLQILKKVFADEIEIKRAGLQISFNQMTMY